MNAAHGYMCKGFDKIFVLATGAPVLSISFRSEVVGDQTRNLWAIGLSWMIFMFCVETYIPHQFLTGLLVARFQQSTKEYRDLPRMLRFFWSLAGLSVIVCFVGGVTCLALFAVDSLGTAPPAAANQP
jgi:Na+/proline symporter